MCGALVAGILTGASGAASPQTPVAQASAHAAESARSLPYCFGTVLWTSRGTLHARSWRVTKKRKWRPQYVHASRAKLGFAPHAYMLNGEGGGRGMWFNDYIAISKRRAVYSFTAVQYKSKKTITIRDKRRIGRLKGKAKPMTSMFDAYFVKKNGRVTYAPNAEKPNKRVRVRGLRLRNFRFGGVAFASTKKLGVVNVMFAVQGKRLVRVVLKGRKVVRAPRVVARGWGSAKGLTTRVCPSASRLSVVRIGKNRKARGFVQRRILAKRPPKLGKGRALAGVYRGRGFGV